MNKNQTTKQTNKAEESDYDSKISEDYPDPNDDKLIENLLLLITITIIFTRVPTENLGTLLLFHIINGRQ